MLSISNQNGFQIKLQSAEQSHRSVCTFSIDHQVTSSCTCFFITVSPRNYLQKVLSLIISSYMHPPSLTPYNPVLLVSSAHPPSQRSGGGDGKQRKDAARQAWSLEGWCPSSCNMPSLPPPSSSGTCPIPSCTAPSPKRQINKPSVISYHGQQDDNCLET